MNSKRSIVVAMCLLAFISASAQESDIDDGKQLEKKQMEKQDYIPNIHGTIRAKYEHTTTFDKGRFQVRNARFSVSGNVHPIVAYKAEIDLSDEGETRMLDAYIRVFPFNGASLTMGQMKVPFSTDNLRSPHQMFFANRSFVAKEITGVRDVGAMVGYNFWKAAPTSIVAGIYNGSGLYRQDQWQSSFDYAVRAVMEPTKGMQLSLNYHSMKPADARMHMYDVGFFYNFANFHVEAEYIYKKFENELFHPVQALNSFIAYDLMLPKYLHKITFMARYDIMTDDNTGLANDNGEYVVTDVARQRITGGVSLSLTQKVTSLLSLNYEKYFYSDWALADPAKQDKLCVELMVRF